MSTATGSIWNPNSWHWEERDYTEKTKKIISELISNLQFEDSSFQFKFQPTEITGQASVSVRKGKFICVYEFDVYVKWEAQKDGQIYSGKIEFKSIEEGADCEVYFQSDDNTDDCKLACKTLQNKKHTFFDVFKKIESIIEKTEFSDENKNKDSERRKQEKEIAQKANIENKKQQMEIAEMEKSRDEMRKQKHDSTPQKISPQLQGQGSIWNVNSYHWEEKSMSSWSINTLKNMLLNNKIWLLNKSIEVFFFDAVVTGEASTTIRKGKKIVFFELTFSVSWKANCRNEAGDFLCDANGKIEASEFSSEDEVDECNIIYEFDHHLACQERINDAMKTEGDKQIKQILKNFILELKKQ